MESSLPPRSCRTPNPQYDIVLHLRSSTGPNPFGPNWAVLILPFIEQDNLYRLSDAAGYPGFSPVPPDNSGSIVAGLPFDLNWLQIVGTPVPIYKCPSDSYNEANYLDPVSGPIGGPAAGWARGNYGVSAGYEDYDHQNGGASYTTKAAGIPKQFGMVSSPVMAANYGAKLITIPDGTSNTIMVAELRAGLSPVDLRSCGARLPRIEHRKWRPRIL